MARYVEGSDRSQVTLLPGAHLTPAGITEPLADVMEADGGHGE